MLKLNTVTTGISNVVNMKLEDANLSVDVLEVKSMTNQAEVQEYDLQNGRTDGHMDTQGRVQSKVW